MKTGLFQCNIIQKRMKHKTEDS